MSRYAINLLASRDLSEIADYFAKTNLEAGEQFFREFNRKCQQLVAFPNSGKSYVQIYSHDKRHRKKAITYYRKHNLVLLFCVSVRKFNNKFNNKI